MGFEEFCLVMQRAGAVSRCVEKDGEKIVFFNGEYYILALQTFIRLLPFVSDSIVEDFDPGKYVAFMAHLTQALAVKNTFSEGAEEALNDIIRKLEKKDEELLRELETIMEFFLADLKFNPVAQGIYLTMRQLAEAESLVRRRARGSEGA